MKYSHEPSSKHILIARGCYLRKDRIVNTVKTLYKGLEGTVKCCLLYQVDLISGVLKIILSCTKISESVILVIVIKTILYYIKL